MKKTHGFLAAVLLAGMVLTISSVCFAGDDDRNSTLNGYYSGTPLGAAASDLYGQSHYYVPGYALSPGMRSYRYGTGQPTYGQPYAPVQRLKRATPAVGPLHPYRSGESDENAKGDPYR